MLHFVICMYVIIAHLSLVFANNCNYVIPLLKAILLHIRSTWQVLSLCFTSFCFFHPPVVDEDDLQDEGDPVDEIDPLLDDLSPDDKLSALEKLDKYFQSEEMGERYIYGCV